MTRILFAAIVLALIPTGSPAQTGGTLLHADEPDAIIASHRPVPLKEAAGVEHRVLVEEFTGAWCGYCPQGTVAMTLLANAEPRMIPVAIHAGEGIDAMKLDDGLELAATLVASCPTVVVDRVRWRDLDRTMVGLGELQERIAMRLAEPAAVSVDIARRFNQATRELEATVTASFVAEVDPGDYRINLYVLEDSVTGVGPGYDQANVYNDNTDHPYYKAGNPIIGFPHRHVLRAMAGGTWGTPGAIPRLPEPGEIYTATYRYTMPAGFDERRVSLVGFVARHGDGKTRRDILNSAEAQLIPPASGIMAEGTTGVTMTVEPLQAGGEATIRIALPTGGAARLELHDGLGRLVSTIHAGMVEAGRRSFAVDLSGAPAGIYWVTAEVGGRRFARSLHVVR